MPSTLPFSETKKCLSLLVSLVLGTQQILFPPLQKQLGPSALVRVQSMKTSISPRFFLSIPLRFHYLGIRPFEAFIPLSTEFLSKNWCVAHPLHMALQKLVKSCTPRASRNKNQYIEKHSSPWMKVETKMLGSEQNLLETRPVKKTTGWSLFHCTKSQGVHFFGKKTRQTLFLEKKNHRARPFFSKKKVTGRTLFC